MLIPYAGSVNQIVPSRATTTSLGELNRTPLNDSVIPVSSPS